MLRIIYHAIFHLKYVERSKIYYEFLCINVYKVSSMRGSLGEKGIHFTIIYHPFLILLLCTTQKPIMLLY